VKEVTRKVSSPQGPSGAVGSKGTIAGIRGGGEKTGGVQGSTLATGGLPSKGGEKKLHVPGGRGLSRFFSSLTSVKRKGCVRQHSGVQQRKTRMKQSKKKQREENSRKQKGEKLRTFLFKDSKQKPPLRRKGGRGGTLSVLEKGKHPVEEREKA